MNTQDLLVQSRFRNAVLWDKMAGRTAAEVCREIGVCQSEFGGFLNLKRSPKMKDGNYRPVAQKIAEHFKMLPEDLFPATLYALTLPDRVERTFDSEHVMLSLQCAEARMLPDATDLDEKLVSEELADEVGETLHQLSPRAEAIIKMRFGLEDGVEHTLEQVGEAFGINKERVRQIEAKALRHLRHPSLSKRLKPFLEGNSRNYL